MRVFVYLCYAINNELMKKRYVNEIIIHCSATPEGRDYTVEDIDKWHRAKGWAGIGYHYVIYRDGSIHKGRDEAKVGAHCLGHNLTSIGVCYIGGLSAKDGKTAKDTRTKEQKTALTALLKELKTRYPTAKVYGHRDFATKDCPCFDAKAEYSDI